MSVNWSAFDWQSFSILVTGGLAVAAALVVGLRQAGIAKRQTDILDKQRELAEIALRGELFDRRFSCYLAVKDLLAEIVRTAERPSRHSEAAFLAALNESRFLFRHEVHERLDRLWKLVCSFSALNATTRGNFERSGEYGPQLEVEHKRLDEIVQSLTGLPDLFGNELRLTGASGSDLRDKNGG